jgi:hypothetical protein
MNYQKFIEARFRIINKEQQEQPFVLNKIQSDFLNKTTGRDVILKARQQGFSSLILAIFTADFILQRNSVNYVVADIDDNATGLLARVKYYIKAYEEITGKTVPLKYNSKTELVNEAMNSTYKIGTAKNAEFGRSKTITNLHLSEFAFYPDPEKIMAGAGTAVVPNGRIIVETTANGFNEFKTFWEESKLDETGFTPLFYKASDFYSQDFLGSERKRLKRLYPQEYPETDTEAFLTSGDLFFDSEALKYYLDSSREPAQNEQFTNL